MNAEQTSPFHGIYIHPFLPLTLSQAQEIVGERSNGTYHVPIHAGEVIVEPEVEVSGEWCLDELEALTIVLRHQFNLEPRPDRRPLVGSEDPHFGRILNDAASALEMHPDCQLDGMSGSKGGRAWLDGQWTIDTLEVLCAAIRYEAGERARGAVDALVTREWLGATQGTVGVPNWTESALLWSEKEMLWLNRHGIHADGVPKLRRLFDTHKAKGWSLPRIVCAANEYEVVSPPTSLSGVGLFDTTKPHTVIVPSPRHGGLMFKNAANLLNGSTANALSERQGFIDQHENFHTREEAWLIASAQNQILREDGGRPGRLYSEHLY